MTKFRWQGYDSHRDVLAFRVTDAQLLSNFAKSVWHHTEYLVTFSGAQNLLVLRFPETLLYQYVTSCIVKFPDTQLSPVLQNIINTRFHSALPDTCTQLPMFIEYTTCYHIS